MANRSMVPPASPATRRIRVPRSFAQDLDPRTRRALVTAMRVAQGQHVIEQMPNAECYMPRPTRILRVTAATAVLAGGATSAAFPVQWPTKCHVVGLSFGTIEGTAAALSALSVRIQKEGTFDLVTDGQAAAFMHVAAMIATNGVTNAGFFPWYSYADQGVIWNVTIKNESAGTNATPTVHFHYVDPRDLEESDDEDDAS